ncbi:MAG: FkbM family methyltransferase, partial [Phycisphaerae bacterium]
RVQDIDGLPNERTGPDVVLVRTLDAIVDEARTRWPKAAVTFVKIDVEGMEIDVLRGAAQLLSEARPQLSVELASHSAFEEAGSFLAELGYKHVGRFCATPTYHFINPSVHRLRKLPPRILRSWYDGRLRKLRDVLGMKSS